VERKLSTYLLVQTHWDTPGHKEIVMPVKSMPDKAALTIDEARYVCNIGRSTLYEEIKAGRIRAIKFGKRTLIPADEPAKWLERLAALAAA
jgi:excisionase family DNA binding protein